MSVHGPADPVRGNPSPESQECWNSSYIEPVCQSWILLGVYLHNDSLPRHIPCCFLHNLCKFNAVGSPGGPEFRQDRPLAALYETIETLIRQRDRSCIERRKDRVTFTAFPRFPLARSRDPVGRAASWAANNVC